MMTDITECVDHELVRLVMNDEDLYKIRHDLRLLLEELNKSFVFTKVQLIELLSDLVVDEMINRHVFEHTQGE
jgi:hypothetical protein